MASDKELVLFIFLCIYSIFTFIIIKVINWTKEKKLYKGLSKGRKYRICSRVYRGLCDAHSSPNSKLKTRFIFWSHFCSRWSSCTLFSSPIKLTCPSVCGTDGWGLCLYMFRGQARPTQQGSSSHQRLTSTSSSGHVQRQNPSLLSSPLNWHEVSDIKTTHKPLVYFTVN